jgi:hypothetical protein
MQHEGGLYGTAALDCATQCGNLGTSSRTRHLSNGTRLGSAYSHRVRNLPDALCKVCKVLHTVVRGGPRLLGGIS